MDYMTEGLKLGLSYKQSAMLSEAIYSCAIEGNKLPDEKEFKIMVKAIKEANK